MIELVIFKEEHLDLIEKKKSFDDDPGIIERTRLLCDHPDTHCHTVMYNGKPAAILGGTLFWQGVMEIWSITSDLVKKSPFSFHKISLRLLNFYWHELKLRRMQFTVRKDFYQGHRWAMALGFEKECLMRKFGPSGHDYYLYGRLQ